MVHILSVTMHDDVGLTTDRAGEQSELAGGQRVAATGSVLCRRL